jgi:glycosyltransferase involved in cell wall biosynthesis
MTVATSRRIVFVINSLGPGGAERVMENVLRMAPSGWDCHLITLDRDTEHRTPPSFVKVHRLDCRFGLMAAIRGLLVEFRALRPDLVVSFLVRASVASTIAARAVGAPVIVSERVHLSAHLKGRHKGLKQWASGLLPRLAYPHARHIIAVSEGVRRDLVDRFGVRPERVTSIPNPYDLDRIEGDAKARPEVELPDRFIVGVGRLVGSKGFADLIEAHSRAKIGLPLYILGEGPDRDQIEAQIAALGLHGSVHLLGYLRNPFAVVSRAHMFVSASLCEGFPNAMAEAMALGVPVVATDCHSGPAEILDDVETTHCSEAYEAKFGMLVPISRPEVLARAIQMMSEPERRNRYARLARQRMADFRIDAIAERYWKTFESAATDEPVRAPSNVRRWLQRRPQARREGA